MDSRGPKWSGTEDPTGEDHPLFSTFKPIGEDNKGSTKPGTNTILVQARGDEQPLGHHGTHSKVPPGFWPSPPGCSSPEGDPQLVALRAQTRLWFEQTQAKRLETKGQLPPWFHGFISRREAEQLLQDQPPGCFLVRFSESTVGFVLSYRGRDRCRHFVLDQLLDGRYVILGEGSAHAHLGDLLHHYSTNPVTPYHEVLTVPRTREDKSQGGTWTPPGSDVTRSPSSEAKFRAYSTVSKRSRNPPGPAEPNAGGGSSREAPDVPPPLPAKGSSLATAQGSPGPAGGGAAPGGPNAPVSRGTALPELTTAPPLADAKYQELLCFHTYAEPHVGTTSRSSIHPEPHMGTTSRSSIHPEPHVGTTSRSSTHPEPHVGTTSRSSIHPEPHVGTTSRSSTHSESHVGTTSRSSTHSESHVGTTSSSPTYAELQEPIPFYAMGRGSNPKANLEENIYSEVASARQDLPVPHPKGSPGGFSTLAPKARAHRRLFRSISSQASKKRQLPAAPTMDGKERGASNPSVKGTRNPLLEFDDPIYSWRTSTPRPGGQEGLENIYEQLSGHHH